MSQRSVLALTLCLSMLVAALPANAACVDLKQTGTLSFEGALSYRIFAGPPNYEDVRKGDTPEPSYILSLDAPICATGDEFIDRPFDRIQIYPAEVECAGHAL